MPPPPLAQSFDQARVAASINKAVQATSLRSVPDLKRYAKK